MTIRDRVGVYDQAEFAENPEARCSIVLILDVSGSMAGQKIDTLSQALVKFGILKWLSRSVAAVSQSQPGDTIRLPQPDYLNF